MTARSFPRMAGRVPRQSTMQIFFWPLIISLAALAGLILGLTGDGYRDVVAVALVAFGPVLIILSLRRKSQTRNPVRVKARS